MGFISQGKFLKNILCLGLESAGFCLWSDYGVGLKEIDIKSFYVECQEESELK